MYWTWINFEVQYQRIALPGIPATIFVALPDRFGPKRCVWKYNYLPFGDRKTFILHIKLSAMIFKMLHVEAPNFHLLDLVHQAAFEAGVLRLQFVRIFYEYSNLLLRSFTVTSLTSPLAIERDETKGFLAPGIAGVALASGLPSYEEKVRASTLQRFFLDFVRLSRDLPLPWALLSSRPRFSGVLVCILSWGVATLSWDETRFLLMLSLCNAISQNLLWVLWLLL